jgi:hypothetical protein
MLTKRFRLNGQTKDNGQIKEPSLLPKRVKAMSRPTILKQNQSF